MAGLLGVHSRIVDSQDLLPVRLAEHHDDRIAVAAAHLLPGGHVDPAEPGGDLDGAGRTKH